MNRIAIGESSVSHTSAPVPPRAEILQGKLVFTSGDEPSLSMFMPMHYEKNYSYPLIVWLHGEHDDERQLQRVMPFISLRNYVAVAPQGLTKSQRSLTESECSNQSQRSYDWPQTDASFEHAYRSIWHGIERATERCNINRRKVLLVGFGSGGSMALRIGLRSPDLFSGIVAIGGGLPSTNGLFAGLNRARELPILLSHGRDSVDYNEDQVCNDLRLLHTAGFNVTVRQYPCGDDLTDLMLRDANVWLMERVTGQHATS